LPHDTFDIAFCQLGLQFVADKPAALREMHRVLGPGGRAFVSTPTPSRFFDVLDDVFARHVGEGAAAFVRMVFSLNDPAGIEELFRSAGFSEVKTHTHTKALQLPSGREFLWQYVHCTPLAGLLSQLTSEQTAALERDVARGWQPWANNEGMAYEQGMIVTTARK
jgi:SAM-dependent methyltransferase